MDCQSKRRRHNLLALLLSVSAATCSAPQDDHADIAPARGKTVHVQEGSLKADLLEATDEVIIAGGTLDVLQVKAPNVTIDPEASGTCLVVECRNEQGNTKVRGGFRSVAEARHAFERFQGMGGEGETSSSSADTVEADEAPAKPKAKKAKAEPEETKTSEDGARTAATQEFRAMDSKPDAAQRPAPSLPRSSVFRKRK